MTVKEVIDFLAPRDEVHPLIEELKQYPLDWEVTRAKDPKTGFLIITIAAPGAILTPEEAHKRDVKQYERTRDWLTGGPLRPE